jgi:hypothetical protein
MNTFVSGGLLLFTRETNFATIANPRQSTELTRHNRANAFNEFLPALSKAVISHNSNQVSVIAHIGG